jgi:dTDP-glucose 4,6-dehydratase
MKLLVTGNCGFIGQNFVRIYKHEHEIFGIDKLGYASDKNASKLCCQYYFDICDIDKSNIPTDFDAIINFAAESHVDNSIKSPEPFVYSNIIGTFKLLEFAKKYNIPKFVQISTDEVNGDLKPDELPFSDFYKLKPSSPYSASKASADCLVNSYHKTYGLHTIITRSCNNYGPYQYKEKLIPVVINNALNDKPIPLYGDGLNVREWMYVKDNCKGIMAALLNGKSGEIYNLGSGLEYSNKDLINNILTLMNKPLSLIQFVEDRKGHDRRYALNSYKSYKKLKWGPIITLHTGLNRTIKWFKNNSNYWEENY